MKLRGRRVGGKNGRPGGRTPEDSAPVAAGSGTGSTDGSFVEFLGKDEVHDGLFAAVGAFAVSFLEIVGECDDGASPPAVSLPPGMGGDGFPGVPVEQGGIDKVIEGPHACPSAVGSAKEAYADDEPVPHQCHGYDGGHEQESGATFFEGGQEHGEASRCGAAGVAGSTSTPFCAEGTFTRSRFFRNPSVEWGRPADFSARRDWSWVRDPMGALEGSLVWVSVSRRDCVGGN